MGFITKLKSAFSAEKTADNVANGDTVESIMNDIEHDAFAVSDSNVLYAGLNELGGYYFVQTVIVGHFKVKSKKGAQLFIKGKGLDLNLNSDSEEFESDHTDVKGRYITKIDFQIEEKEAAKIDRDHVDTLTLNCKSKSYAFEVIKTKS